MALAKVEQLGKHQGLRDNYWLRVYDWVERLLLVGTTEQVVLERASSVRVVLGEFQVDQQRGCSSHSVESVLGETVNEQVVGGSDERFLLELLVLFFDLAELVVDFESELLK